MRQTAKFRQYKELIETIAKVEYQRFSIPQLIDLPELINIGNHTLYILFKEDNLQEHTSAYIATAIKWAIRNEVRRRYKWYSLKNKKNEQISDEAEGFRLEVYKTILSIDEMADAEVPTHIKTEDKTPEETTELTELKGEILQAMKYLTQRERELIEAKFFQDKKLKDISDEFNISQSRISRIIKIALDKIKKELKKQGVI